MASRSVSIQPGVAVFVHELNALPPAALLGRSVRVIGRVLECHAARNRVIVDHAQEQLLVDSSLLVDVKLAPRTLLQFIGEIEQTDEAPFRFLLRARVSRNVTGMDLTLYEQVLRLRRAAEASVTDV